MDADTLHKLFDFFAPLHQGHHHQPAQQWQCARCSFSNFSWRKECFKCHGTVKRSKVQTKELQKPKTDPSNVKYDSTPSPSASASVSRPRRPSPEVTAAEANVHAAALEQSAVHLRAAGLTAKAEELEAQSGKLEKKVKALEAEAGKHEKKVK